MSFVTIKNKHRDYIRWGANTSSGYDRQDILIVNPDGTLHEDTPVIWDFKADEQYIHNWAGTTFRKDADGHPTWWGARYVEHSAISYIRIVEANDTPITVENGTLKTVTETTGIRIENGELISDAGRLSMDSWVSMNLWGFHGNAINEMEEYFYNFLRELPEGELKRECYLPSFVSNRMENGCTVSSCISGDKWFGMTYAEDRPAVISRLQALHDAEKYPQRLF